MRMLTACINRLSLFWRSPVPVALLVLLAGLVVAVLVGLYLQQVRRLDPFWVMALISLFSALLSALFHACLLGYQHSRELGLNNARMAAIIDSANDAIIVKDLDGVIQAWNHAAERIFGYRADEAIGRRIGELIVPADRAGEEVHILASMARGEVVPHFNTVRRRADGSMVNVSVTVSPVRSESGQVVGAAKTLRDVTEQMASDARIRDLNASLEAQVIRRTAELETARRDLQTVFDAVPSLIGYWDRALIIRVANQASRHWFGLAPDNLLGMHVSELLGPEQYLQDMPHIEAALRGEPQTFERARTGLDGAMRHSLTHYLPDVVGGEVRGFYVIAHDVTEITSSRLRLTDALRENEVLLRTINQQMLYSVTDVAGRILEVNDNFCRVSGYSREELLGQNHRMINSGEHPHAFWKDMWSRISSGQAWHGEVCNRAKDGMLYWVDSVIAPFIGADGRIERYVSVRTDITQRKAAEAELNRVATLLGNVLGSALQVSIVATDVDGTISIFNAGAEHLLGYDAGEMIGRQTPAILHDPAEVDARGAELSAEYGQPVEGFRVLVHKPEREGLEIREWTYIRKDGSRILVSLAVTTMRDAQGRIVGYLGVAQDITARHQFESELRMAKAAAEEANQAKSDFLAKMSHEIRTPMNGILGMCYLLERQEIPSASQGMVQKIQSASQSLLGIINDILDFSKIEARRLDIEQVPFRLNDVIDNLAGIMSSAVGDKPVEVVVSAAPQGAEYLKGDPLRLGQVLINLVGNAIKFTRQGEVVVDIRVIEDAGHDNRLMLRFSVRDTGIGIAQDQLRRIFHAFSQADASTTRSFGGTGLGLTISRNLVELMGGRIEVNSELGRGSEFVVDLPFERSHPGELADVVAPAADQGRRLAGLRVLVVDDSDLNRDVATYILTGEGAQVVVAADGQAALTLLETEGAAFDIVLMDIQMPVMDGYEATRQIRAHAELMHLPVVALTAGALGSQRDAAIAAGMNGFIAKPFNVEELVTTVRSLVAGDVGPPAEASDDLLALDQDPAWLALTREFAERFRMGRVSEFLALFDSLQGQVVTDWDPDLKGLLHKIAGEAGMAGLPGIGDQARAIEQRWDELGTPDETLREMTAALAAELRHHLAT